MFNFRGWSPRRKPALQARAESSRVESHYFFFPVTGVRDPLLSLFVASRGFFLPQSVLILGPEYHQLSNETLIWDDVWKRGRDLPRLAGAL